MGLFVDSVVIGGVDGGITGLRVNAFGLLLLSLPSFFLNQAIRFLLHSFASEIGLSLFKCVTRDSVLTGFFGEHEAVSEVVMGLWGYRYHLG